MWMEGKERVLYKEGGGREAVEEEGWNHCTLGLSDPDESQAGKPSQSEGEAGISCSNCGGLF